MLENTATSRLVLQARGSHSLTVPFPRDVMSQPRSLSEKQVKADKDLRRSAEERFFVFRGFRTFCL